MRPQGSSTELEARRRRAAEHFQERMPLQEIADRFGVTLTSVKRWKRAWKADGVEGLAAKRHPGPKPKLSEQHRRGLVEILLAGPVAAGFRTNLWTCKRVARTIRKRFKVSYHPDHVRRILHDLGFSPQKPRRVAREQDAAAVERWRTRDWPRIKKKRGVAAPALFLSTKRAFGSSR